MRPELRSTRIGQPMQQHAEIDDLRETVRYEPLEILDLTTHIVPARSGPNDHRHQGQA